MDGYLAPLDEICDLAEHYDALVMVDDSHAVGFTGPTGRGTPELFGVQDRVDIITGTLGKALGGASGGYTSGRKEIVELLRQRSRPYLFSNSLAPSITAAAIATLDLLVQFDGAARPQLQVEHRALPRRMTEAGFDLLPGEHPIIPVMIGDAARGGQAGGSAARRRASTSSASRTRSCRTARRASARRCRLHTPPRTLTAPWTRLSPHAKRCEHRTCTGSKNYFLRGYSEGNNGAGTRLHF